MSLSGSGDPDVHYLLQQAIDRLDKTVEKLENIVREDLRDFNTRMVSVELKVAGIERAYEERSRAELRIASLLEQQGKTRSWVTQLVFGIVGAIFSLIGIAIAGALGFWKK
jgi:hypothetical protein